MQVHVIWPASLPDERIAPLRIRVQARRTGRLKNGLPKATCGGQRTHFRLEVFKLRV